LGAARPTLDDNVDSNLPHPHSHLPDRTLSDCYSTGLSRQLYSNFVYFIDILVSCAAPDFLSVTRIREASFVYSALPLYSGQGIIHCYPIYSTSSMSPYAISNGCECWPTSDRVHGRTPDSTWLELRALISGFSVRDTHLISRDYHCPVKHFLVILAPSTYKVFLFIDSWSRSCSPGLYHNSVEHKGRYDTLLFTAMYSMY
jgi:hypothetical protein